MQQQHSLNEKLPFHITSEGFIDANILWAAILYFLYYLTIMQQTDSNYWFTQTPKPLKICNIHWMKKHNHHDSKTDQ